MTDLDTLAERVEVGLTVPQRELLLRFNLSSGPDALLHIETAADERMLYELLALGLSSHIRAVHVFGQLTDLGRAVYAIAMKDQPHDRH